MNTFHERFHDKAKNMVTIVLADDHMMMREGTRRLLEEDATLVVVGEARDGAEAIALCQELHPVVLILDIAMKGINGFTAAQRVLAEHGQPTHTLILTGYSQVAYIQTMLGLGVRGYWLKSAGSSDIRQAVHDVAAGKESLDPEIRQILAEEGAFHLLRSLTSREQEVLRLVVQGLRNGEISEQLHVTVKTVEAHLTSLYQKLGVQSRTEAITLAQQQGLLLNFE